MQFEQLLKPHYQDAVRFSRALAGSKHDGDDLLQESLIKAWKGLHKLKQVEKFKSWLFKIISNTHRSLARRQWVKRMVGLEEVADVCQPETLSFEEKDLIRQALRGLPRVQREALVMFEIMGMTIIEIADHQKMSQSAVKSRLVRGRAKLLERYQALSNTEVYDETGVVQTG
ncbi:MAG: RNA polymerase sigma factor [Candidatus Electryoneaceae bacterium]|nr:RNA polymerase sigma factor [Candidatus Electryoneaceae bacterium]